MPKESQCATCIFDRSPDSCKKLGLKPAMYSQDAVVCPKKQISVDS